MKSSLQDCETILPFFYLKNHLKKFQKQKTKWLFGFLILFTSYFSANAQPASCTHINCTSNDVRIISAYISGQGNTAIDCGSLNPNGPFDNAELHLLLSTNTQRKGVSITSFLKIDATDSFGVSQCFTGVMLNAGSPNDLVFNLGSTLDNIACGVDNFTLADVFISWGTGNTDFCNSSTAPECPATPAKCRFKPGETIPVTVKLDVDFISFPGDCADKTNLTVQFTPSITAQNIQYPVTFTWDFGDGQTGSTTANSNSAQDLLNAGISHTYTSAITYTVKLTATDATTPTPITKTVQHDITLQVCEVCTPPSDCTGDLTLCATSGTANPPTAVFDLTTSKCNSQVNGGWFTDPGFLTADQITDPTSVTASDGTKVYGLIFDDCGDQATATVTLHVNPKPTVAITNPKPVCSPATVDLTAAAVTNGSTAGLTFTYFTDAGATTTLTNPNAVATGGTYYIVGTLLGTTGCADTEAVSVTINPKPTVVITNPLAVCSPSTVDLTAAAVTAGSTTGLTFTYFTNAGATTTLNNPNAVSTGGTYYIVGTLATGCADTEAVTVVVKSQPPCTITRTGTAPLPPIIVGTSFNFCGPTATLPDVYSYAWSITLNTAGATFVGSHGTGDACVNVTTSTIGSYTLSLVVTNTTTNCVSSTCTYPVKVGAVGPFTVYTQGFYGNSGGKACNGQYSYTISYNAVVAAGGSIRFGDPNPSSTKSFTLSQVEISNSKTSNIFKMLPGGTTPAVLKGSAAFKNCGAGIITASFGQSCTWPSVPMTPSIGNVLLAQIMALRFNLFYSQSLGNLLLTGNVIKTVKPTSSCGSTYPTTGGTTYTIPCSVFNALKQMSGGATINNLYLLANQVLGGVVTTITPGDMNTAVNIINVGFDGGGEIIAMSSSTCVSQTNQAITNTSERIQPVITTLSVSAYPNPFNDKVMFVIQSPVSGKAKLDVYDMLGQKLRTVFDGQVFGGMKQMIEFNVPASQRMDLIYIFRVNDQQVVGKLINIKQ